MIFYDTNLMKNWYIAILLIYSCIVVYIIIERNRKADSRYIRTNSYAAKSEQFDKATIIPTNIKSFIKQLSNFRYYNPDVFDTGIEIIYKYYLRGEQDKEYLQYAIDTFEQLSFSMPVDESFKYQEYLNELSCLLGINEETILPANHTNDNYFE